MRKRMIVAAVLGSALAFSQVGVASAASSTSTATVTANVTAGSIGLRSITSVPAIVLSSSAGSDKVSGTMSAVVSEAAVTGVSPWSVTADLSSLSDGTHTLANSNVDLYGRATVQTAGGGTSSNPTGSQVLSAQRTLMTNTGQSTTAAYTGTYTTSASLDLNIPNGTSTGIYTGTMTVTLFQ
jgi:hypothetical protein